MSPRGPPRSPLQTSSPLSPSRMESLAIPSQQRRRPNRQHSGVSSANSLRLPSLPRFHPANFPSQQNSHNNTPTTGPSSSLAPVSPRQQQKQYSEAQRQLYMYQRELMANARNNNNNNNTNNRPVAGPKPVSPRLIPLGSPGPVTPLELEQHNAAGYFVAGTGTSSASQSAQNDLVEKLIMEEANRRNNMPTSIQGRPVASR